MELFSPRNLLLMDTKTGAFVVAVDACKFARYPTGETPNDHNTSYGVEWMQGVYLQNTPSKIDFYELRKEYGEERKIETLEEYHDMLSTKFAHYERIVGDELLSDSLRELAEQSMYQEFLTGKRQTFEDNLYDGKYDSDFIGEKQRRR